MESSFKEKNWINSKHSHISVHPLPVHQSNGCLGNQSPTRPVLRKNSHGIRGGGPPGWEPRTASSEEHDEHVTAPGHSHTAGLPNFDLTHSLRTAKVFPRGVCWKPSLAKFWETKQKGRIPTVICGKLPRIQNHTWQASQKWRRQNWTERMQEWMMSQHFS